MTEEQRKALDEYNVQAKAIAEALEKHRKALELELKKLRSEVTETVKAFDDKVLALYSLRSAVVTFLHIQELYCCRLGLAVMTTENRVYSIADAEKKLVDLGTQKEAIIAQCTVFEGSKENEEQKLSALQGELLTKEKNFRKDIQESSTAPFDQDTVKMLLSLYKSKKSSIDRGSRTTYSNNAGSAGMSSSRQSGGGGRMRSSIGGRKSTASKRRSFSSRNKRSFSSTDEGGDMGPLQAAMMEAQQMASQGLWTSVRDPFLPSDEARAKAMEYAEVQQVNYVPLQIDDLPEAASRITDQTFEKLNKLRKERAETENKIQEQAARLKEAVKHTDRSKEQLTSTENSIEALHHALDTLADEKTLDQKNVEILSVFKHGQDEIEQKSTSTDYSSGILLPLSIINDTNKGIKSLGEDKVKVLEKTLNFRKKINFMKWEHEFLDLKVKDMDAHYTDLQLLRVNKQLKQIISGAKTESDRTKMERAEMRISKLHSTHQSKVKKMEGEQRGIARAIKDRVKENSKLDEQLKDLESNVGVRESIFKSRMEASGGSSDASSRKMKRVTVRRKLVDLARAQTDEIEFLRQELDRLRQKTFPSFADAARDRYKEMPDEVQEYY